MMGMTTTSCREPGSKNLWFIGSFISGWARREMGSALTNVASTRPAAELNDAKADS
jgi:hypothetical protein